MLQLPHMCGCEEDDNAEDEVLDVVLDAKGNAHSRGGEGEQQRPVREGLCYSSGSGGNVG